jgi:hypothetical protein
MKISAFTIHQWFGVGLCILGLAMPVFSIFYARNEINRFLNYPWAYLWQWLPFTVLLWLLASYMWTDGQWRLLAWIIFIIGILLSPISWVLWRLNQ